MARLRLVIILTPLLLCGCPGRHTVERQFNFVDYDAPALRLACPVQAELLEKDQYGAWNNIGTGEIPAGAYIKGRCPPEFCTPTPAL